MAGALRRAGYTVAVVAAAAAGFSALGAVIAPTNAASVFFAFCALGLGVLTYVAAAQAGALAMEPEAAAEALAPTRRASDGQRRRRRVIVHAPRRGFFGWAFLLIFFAFNAVMACALVGLLVHLGRLPDTNLATRGYGPIFGVGLMLFLWVCGAVITGLLALVAHGHGQRTVIEEEIEQ